MNASDSAFQTIIHTIAGELSDLTDLAQATRIIFKLLLAALLGGMLAADAALDISPAYFLSALPRAVPIANLWLATAKSAVFGILIALIGCYFGMKVKPNTESLGRGTTSSVVTSITAVILVDALFAVLFKGIGFRG